MINFSCHKDKHFISLIGQFKQKSLRLMTDSVGKTIRRTYTLASLKSKTYSLAVGGESP